MGLGICAVQNILELYKLGYLKNSNSVLEIGSQELHLKKEDLKELFDIVGLKKDIVDEYPDVKNYPFQPRTSSKYLYKTLGIKEYKSIDISGLLDAIPHDLNKPFEDRSKFNKFDIVTDFGSCEHVFDIAECYRTMHNLTKPNGYMIIQQALMKGNGYFKFDESFIEGIAAANNYKIIICFYLIHTPDKTKNGSDYQFFMPRNQILLGYLNFSKFFDAAAFHTLTKFAPADICIHGVLQKTKEDEFKIPYQHGLMKETYNISGGFNRVHLQEPMSYTYVPSATLTINEAPLTHIIKALVKWFTKKIRRFIRIIIMKIFH